MQLENKATQNTEKLLICDTDLLETKVYGEAYFNWCPPELEYHALENTYDLYFLTYIDVPWEADDLRDRPEQREDMFLQFKQALVTYKRPFVLIKGSLDERMATATEHLNKLLS